jgi:hypothetical protein
MNTSESITKISQALVTAQAELGHAPTNGENPHFKSKYADLPSIIDTIRPVLAKHGLACIQRSMDADGGVKTQTVILHQSGEWIADDGLFVPAGKKDAQGFGSAQTYSRRYGMATLLGIAAGEDDDGNAAVKSQRQQTVEKPAKPSDPRIAALSKRAEALPDDVRELLKKQIREARINMRDASDDDVARLQTWIEAAEDQAEADEAQGVSA